MDLSVVYARCLMIIFDLGLFLNTVLVSNIDTL